LVNYLTHIIAFASAGIYPLNKECIDNETNKSLLRLGTNTIQNSSPEMQKFNYFIGKYNYKDHIKNLKHLNVDLTTAFDDCVVDSNIKNDIKDVLIAKELLRLETDNRTEEQSKKRKRKAFEDTSKPRILNDKERLKKLQNYNNKKSPKQVLKKQKSDKDTIIHNQQPIEVNLGNNTDFELEEFIIGLEKLENGTFADFVAQNNQDYTFCLYLPINTEALELNPKKDIVKIFLYLE